jgi:multiple sugar transport system substrate-binding protein
MNKKFRIRLLPLTIAAFMFASVMACGGSNAQPSASDNPAASGGSPSNTPIPAGTIEISFWNGFGGSDRTVLETLVKKFNDIQSDVFVNMEIMDWEIVYQKLATSAASNEGPDFICFGPENIATYANMGAIVPIDDFYEQARIDQSLFPELFQRLIKYNGHYIGIPMNFFAHALYYNKDLAVAAGLNPESPPKTWDEMSAWAKAMTDSTNGQYGIYIGIDWVNLVQYLWANGGDIIDYETKSGVLNQPKSVEAVEYFKNLYINDNVSPIIGTNAGEMFTAGKLGMMIDGPWQVPQIKAAGVNYGVALMPAGPERQVTFGAGLSYHLTKKGSSNTAVKEAFYQFVAYWFEKDTQKQWATQIGFPPIRTDLNDDAELLTANPDLKIFMESNNIAQPWLIGIVNSQKILNDVVIRYFEEIFLNGANVQESLDMAQQDLDAILASER